MTFAYSDLTPRELEAFGFARTRDLAFNAVRGLWRRRRSQGMTQKDLATRIGRDPAWVSRRLQGPGNWTLRTIGTFVAALNGEIEIKIHDLEEPPERITNDSGAYEEYGSPKEPPPKAAEQNGSTGNQIIGDPLKHRLGMAASP
jgi:transcriptional regulator with XRE-family HTH domain